MAELATITNLSDLDIWTSGGAHAKTRFSWTYVDPDGGSQGAYRVTVYADSAGVKGAALFNSGKVTSTDGFWDSTTGLVNNTAYWWDLELWDDMDESSGLLGATQFKVLWGQGIYEFNIGASGNQAFSSASMPPNTQKAILFRGATDAYAGTPSYSPWVTSLGDINWDDYTWLQIMVRLATTLSATQPSLTRMAIDYTGATGVPDNWVLDGDWGLDSASYRFGSRSLKCTVASDVDEPSVYPYRFAAGDDIPVIQNTDYTYSCFVRTGVISADSAVRLIVYAGGSDTTVLATGEPGASYGNGETSDSSSAPEGWERLILRFTSPEGVDLVRPKIEYLNGGSGEDDYFWLDAVKFEPGTVASPWAPGWISPAMVLDSYGIDIDGSGGATFRIRHSDGVQEIDGDAIVEGSVGGGGGLTNLDGGHSDTTYGGTTAVDGGTA